MAENKKMDDNESIVFSIALVICGIVSLAAIGSSADCNKRKSRQDKACAGALLSHEWPTVRELCPEEGYIVPK